MRTLLAVMALLIGTAAEAQIARQCQSANLVPGKGWVYTKEPCEDDKLYAPGYKEEIAAMKRKCGKDYEQLRVGMTLDRFEECNGATSYVTETVGKGGVVETWQSTFYWIHVQSGRIVGYTRRKL